MAALKVCSKCELIKAITEFHTRRASLDGLAYKCRPCVKQACREWRQENPGAFKKWRSRNAEHERLRGRRYREANKDRVTSNYARWAKENKHKVNALVAKRIARKLQATPSWADHAAIRAIYEKAARLTAETGVKHEVDHIYPLRGKLVCGLHCEANLQVLTESQNLSKGNKMPDQVLT